MERLSYAARRLKPIFEAGLSRSADNSLLGFDWFRFQVLQTRGIEELSGYCPFQSSSRNNYPQQAYRRSKNLDVSSIC